MIHDIYSHELSSNIMVDFFKYLLDIPRFNYGNISITDSEITFMVKLLKEDTALLFANSMIELVYREHAKDWISSVLYLRMHNNTTMENVNRENSSTSTISLTFPAKNDMNLPHLKLLEDAGGFIRHLCLRDFYKKTSMLKKKNEKFYLDYIFSLCPSLKSLTIKFSSLIECNPFIESPTKNTSVERLEIVSSEMDPKVLTGISVRLPRLKNLCLSNSTFINSINNNIGSSKRKITRVYMPTSSFNNITYHNATMDEGFCFVDKCNVKVVITDSTTINYFTVDSFGVNKSTFKVFNNDSVSTPETTYLEVVCRNLNIIWIKFATGHTQKCIISL